MSANKKHYEERENKEMHDCDNCKHVLKHEDEEPCVHCINSYVLRDMWEPTEDKVVLKQRCKDCKYFFGDDGWKDADEDCADYTYNGICTREELNFVVAYDDYCSFSEAKSASKG